MSERKNLIDGGRLDLDRLAGLFRRPPPFEPGEVCFWDDPYIAKQMLKAHLDPDTEAASRPPETIERSVNWLVEALDLKPGDRLLDLGCGPGLYANRLAARGLQVTGIDLSQNSLDHAQRDAEALGVTVSYLCQNFLTIDYQAQFDAVLQVYGEMCVFSPEARDDLLRRIHRALKPGGHFAFDVSTPKHRAWAAIGNNWYVVADGGFWKPGPHLALEHSFSYDDRIHLDQYIIIEEDGMLSVYRNWYQDHTPESITGVVERQGFTVEGVFADLEGTAYHPDTEWIGIVAAGG